MKKNTVPRDLSKFKEVKGFSVTISLYAQTVIGGVTRSVFKITAEDNTSGNKILGCFTEKNKNSIDIFLKYVLENIPDTGHRASVKELFFGPDQSRSSLIKHKRSAGAEKLKKMNLNDILSSLYRELILGGNKAGVAGYFESSDTVIPPLFVDTFIKDIDKITGFADYFKNRVLTEDEKKFLLGTIGEIGAETAALEKSYDLEKAVLMYNRLISAASRIEGSECFNARYVLKKAKICFHLKDYKKSSELLENCKDIFESGKAFGDLGESYFYMGMIDFYFNRMNEAKEHFSRASRLLGKCSGADRLFLKNSSKIYRYLLSKNYSHALNAVNSALRFASLKSDPKETAELYGLKADIYYADKNYKLSKEALDLQYEYAVISGDIFIEAKCLAQMFQLISKIGIDSEQELNARLNRIKKLSTLCRKQDYYYSCLLTTGIYYYLAKMYKEADRYFSRALRIFRPGTTDAAEHVVGMIYLSKIRIASKNYLSASRVLLRMLRLCEESKIELYPAYIYNLLGRIGYEQGKFTNAVQYFRRCLKQVEKERIKALDLEINSYKLSGLCRLELKDYKKAAKDLYSAMKILKRPKLQKFPGCDADISEIEAALKKIET